MQAKSTIQFKFEPNKEYKCPKDKIDALVEFITKHVQECPAHWIIMSPDLVSIYVPTNELGGYTESLRMSRRNERSGVPRLFRQPLHPELWTSEGFHRRHGHWVSLGKQ